MMNGYMIILVQFINFREKEANEVIFVLGCDESQKNRYAVKGFVNSNIVNVAATRAKYRFLHGRGIKRFGEKMNMLTKPSLLWIGYL